MSITVNNSRPTYIFNAHAYAKRQAIPILESRGSLISSHVWESIKSFPCSLRQVTPQPKN